jgi:hypothetical protein
MAELGTVADGGVDIDHAADADEGVAADGDRPRMDVTGLRPVAENHRFLAQN